MGQDEHARICEAYHKMILEAAWRPAGSGSMSPEEIQDTGRFAKEASGYADEFLKAVDSERTLLGTE